MPPIEALELQGISNNVNDAMNVVFSKLDEAIDDMEKGRVLSEKELWAEIDAI